MLRTFGDSGANRDTGKGKFDFYGFRHPLCEHSFGAYMHGHRLLPDGSFRDANNWWGGWDKEVSLKSMDRHCEDLKALHAGFRVFKERDGDAEHTHILQKDETPEPSWREVTEEESCNAIRFNADAYKLQVIQHK